MENPLFPMRINKYIAWKGIATRKDADVLITKRNVTINGRTAVLGDKVQETDVVQVSAKQKKYRYIAYHKPSGVVSHSPQLGEDDIVTAAGVKDVFPVGRLDKRSSGLIILTDDARITDKLLNPDYTHDKEYIVTTAEELPTNFKKRMEAGVNIEGYRTKECKVTVTSPKKFTIVLTEGKKHQIRRMCSALGLAAHDLKRTRIMNIRLGSLPAGAQRPIEGAELSEFLSHLQLR